MNTENTILVSLKSEKCSYSMNLVFSMFFVFFRTKNRTCSQYFPYSSCFSEHQTVFKEGNQTDP